MIQPWFRLHCTSLIFSRFCAACWPSPASSGSPKASIVLQVPESSSSKPGSSTRILICRSMLPEGNLHLGRQQRRLPANTVHLTEYSCYVVCTPYLLCALCWFAAWNRDFVHLVCQAVCCFASPLLPLCLAQPTSEASPSARDGARGKRGRTNTYPAVHSRPKKKKKKKKVHCAEHGVFAVTPYEYCAVRKDAGGLHGAFFGLCCVPLRPPANALTAWPATDAPRTCLPKPPLGRV